MERRSNHRSIRKRVGNNAWIYARVSCSDLETVFVDSGTSSCSISFRPQVKAVACGLVHSAAVTENGDLYTWGCGFQGQTGHASLALDDETNDRLTGVQLLPKLVGSFVRKEKITAVACGARHTAALSSLGEVWCWGEGKCGQLGYPNPNPTPGSNPNKLLK